MDWVDWVDWVGGVGSGRVGGGIGGVWKKVRGFGVEEQHFVMLGEKYFAKIVARVKSFWYFCTSKCLRVMRGCSVR